MSRRRMQSRLQEAAGCRAARVVVARLLAAVLRAVLVLRTVVAALLVVVLRAAVSPAAPRGRTGAGARWPTTSGAPSAPSCALATSAPHCPQCASVLPLASVSSPPHSGQGVVSGRSQATKSHAGKFA